MERCERLGFALSGVCDAAPVARHAEFRAWLAEGKHGSMDYLARNTDARVDPGRVLPGARSVIMVADVYRLRGTREEAATEDALANGRGTIATYARGRDYHKVIKKRLHLLCDELRGRFPTAGFRAFVDTAPVMERDLAQRAGLGWIGKHTLLIHPAIGSCFLLGGVLTTLEIKSSAAPVPDHCGTCTRCIDACPTQAITPHSIDAGRCISYLTIENRGVIDDRFHSAIGNWLYGCDICQDVCPHNSVRPPGADTGRMNPEYAPRRDSFDLLDVLGWTEDDRRREFAGTALTRATLAMMKRNAVIVAGNAISDGCPEPLRSELLGSLKELATSGVESMELASLSEATLKRLASG